MLDSRTHHPGRALRAKGEPALARQLLPIQELRQVRTGDGREHLLADHIRGLAYPPDEELRSLHDRRLHGKIAIPSEDLLGRMLELLPEELAIGQHVIGTLRCVDRHGTGPFFSSL